MWQHSLFLTSRGAAWENGYAERMITTLKEEKAYLHEYDDFYNARNRISHFLDEVYMGKCPTLLFEAESKDRVLLR